MHAIFMRLGVTALYVTHDRDEAFAVADTVVVMDSGRIIRKGTPQDLWADPGHGFVAQMLGFGSALPAVVSNRQADFGWGTVEMEAPDGRQFVVIPPHAVRIAQEGPHRGVVTKSAFASGRYAVEIEIGNATLNAISPHHLAPGDPVRFAIEPGRLLAVDN
jgi:ABC-type sulfate/molybdate transport systems ATPase subunit